ncbi:CHASE3 domain-containing protein [Rhodococcus pyridinivorans]|uniref:histidine kinase n=1 Tax=Rhodococcus pyridinivorans TaxID=103816 RepID=A0A495NIW0_9NOCA|nr:MULTISPECIES: sensor histidine kinase [Rhodococcus]MBX4168708.1 CHASE3 domain-containing protein [Rhodococcus sp. DMU2021]MCD5419675.1 CHASE3 domain-containing protein [Rhodococcus pyridinivorans]QOV98744.1 CHASE3 domain-containing protein [Rhodococcus pyridinivorans]UPW02521.1 CHASE3 domain-containing protein [Rhodococcus pyridinivorans]WMM72648.1 CHASE3 domain-containing protein [Rhodococcus pyridinivorans]
MRDPSVPEPRIERFSSRLVVQSWFQVAFAVLAVFAVLGSIVGGIFIQRTVQITDEVTGRIQPAMTESYRLQSSLLDQQTAVRGYALTTDPIFLGPYRAGRADQQVALDRLRELLADHPELLADIDSIDATARQWQTQYAEPIIATVVPGQPRPVDANLAEEDRLTFGEIRSMFVQENSALSRVLEENLDDLVQSRTIRNSVLIAMVITFILTGLAMVALVHNLVAVPLSKLRNASRRVALEENFYQHIYPQGPKDIRALALDVETMRGRIADALADSRKQQTLLAKQTEDLDSQAEELRRSNTELEQFAYVASHDLQEPLRKVASFCQLLEKRYGDVLDDRGRQYVEYAVDGAKRMQVLISDLLAFSRVGRVHDAYVRVDLGRPLEKALFNLSASIEESQAQIERPDDLPELTGDPTLLTMLWQNLVGNAIKFRHPDRTPVIRIECEKAEDESDGPRWHFCVTDNGIGIDSEYAEKVFVIFQRLHPRDDYQGTGIGLALSKKIVEYHAGRIWIDTEYGDTHTEGTRICFTLGTASRPVEQKQGTTS